MSAHDEAVVTKNRAVKQVTFIPTESGGKTDEAPVTGGAKTMEENKKQPQSTSEQQTESSDPKAPRRGRNWITDMYDKVNLSVDTLNYIALGLLIFIFAVIFIASRH